MSDTPTGTKKAHPMFIVAAGAVTLLCAVGIGVLTGIIPSAHSDSSSTSSAPSPVAAGVASAPIGSADYSAPADQKAALKPVEDSTFGQPLAKSDASAKPAHKATPAKTAKANTNEAQPKAPQAIDLPPPVPAPVVVASAPICRNCGIVDSITPIEKKGESGVAGAVIGGVVGGLLGHQVGAGRGKDLATVAGAVGGAMAGNAIEKNKNTTKTYEVRVRLEDGTFQTVRYDAQPGVRVGDKVKLDGGKVVRE